MLLSSSLIILSLVYLVSQTSSMTSSVMLVIFSLCLALIIRSQASGLLLFAVLFVLVFVGALLVLLLRVVRLSSQEQRQPASLGSLIIRGLCAFSLVLIYKSLVAEEYFGVPSILRGRHISILFMSVTILTTRLLTLTWLILFFRGTVRST